MGASKNLFMAEREAEMNEQEVSITETFTKASIIALADKMTKKYDEGNENALSPFIRLRHLHDALKIALDRLKPFATEEARQYQKGEKVHGVGISVSNGRRTFDYSNDSEWNELKAKMKAREELLKGLQQPMSDMDGVISCPPEIKYSSDVINLGFE